MGNTFSLLDKKNSAPPMKTVGEDRFLIRLPPKNGCFVGVALPAIGVAQLDIDIEHITKFHQDRIKVNGVMLWTDRHTDKPVGGHG